MTVCSLTWLLVLAPVVAGAPVYTKPEMLTQAPDLIKAGARRRPVVLDARPRDAYLAGHIPGAHWVDLAAWSAAVNNGESRQEWQKRIGALGIDLATPVLVYAEARTVDAARVWWMLRYWGFADVRLLDGGWQAWTGAGGRRETAEVKPAPRAPLLKQQAGRLTIRDELTRELQAGKAGQIIDTRSYGEHCGDKKLANRGGAIPGAKHLEWTDTLDPKTGKVRSAAELTRLFRDAGIDPALPSTTYCQSGGRAAMMAFVLELMSGKPARNYYRSWAEWGNHPDTSIIVPKKKESSPGSR